MAKENSIKMKKEPTIWENIFANDISHKCLISKIYKELTWLHSKKTNISSKKWAKDLNRHFSNKDIQRSPKLAKNSNSHFSNKDIQRSQKMLSITSHQKDANWNQNEIPLHQVRMVIINKWTNKCWRECREKRTLVHCWWECRLVQPL